MISETHNRRVEPNPSRDACPVRTIVRYFWRSVGTTDARWRNPFCPRPQLAREPQRSPISRGYSGSACTECAPRRLPRNPPTRRELATCLGEARRRRQECGRELPLYLKGSCRHFDDACVEAGLSVGHGGRCDPSRLANSVHDLGHQHLRRLAACPKSRRRGRPGAVAQLALPLFSGGDVRRLVIAARGVARNWFIALVGRICSLKVG